MKLVMTMMVRDEADIVDRMIAHSIAQGVDHLIVTDNGSVDGTREILESWSARGVLELRDDPVQRKQQSDVVTRMARDAATEYGADWVINADADEFWVGRDPSLTVRDCLEGVDPGIRSFTARVIDMTGAPAWRGSGFSRLVYRDERPVAALRAIGLLAHSTPDAVHVGDPDVRVSQGNHIVSMRSEGAPSPADELEVLHLQWRSWEQYRRKVENAGRSYDANPDLTPSPNHHGMRDWARLRAGTLWGWYVARHPTPTALAEGLSLGELARETRLSGLSDVVADEPMDARTLSGVVPLVEDLVRLDADRLRLDHDLVASREESARTSEELASMTRLADELRSRRVVRAVDRLAELVRR